MQAFRRFRTNMPESTFGCMTSVLNGNFGPEFDQSRSSGKPCYRCSKGHLRVYVTHRVEAIWSALITPRRVCGLFWLELE